MAQWAFGMDFVLLSTAEWDNPFWTNKQHVACELAARGHRVLYLDTVGLRRPSATGQDLKRIMRRLSRFARGPRQVRENLWVWSPVAVPFQGVKAARAINRRILSVSVGLLVRVLGFEEPILWTYNPLTTQLLRTKSFRRVVYHCVDNIAAQPGMPSEVLNACEEELFRRSDVVFVTSRVLADKALQWNSRTYYLPNVADYQHFSAALDIETRVPPDLDRIPRPRIGYIGALSGYKVDFRLLREIAERRKDWSIVLIGKVGEGDPWTDDSLLSGVDNLHVMGPRPYRELPAYLKGIDVALLPNMQNAYTAAMFPMKFFEYLAAGRPVVGVELPSLKEYADAVLVARNADEFVQQIAKALAGEVPPLEYRLEIARRHTYSARTDEMLRILRDIGVSALERCSSGAT